MSLTIIIPCYNEEESIPRVFPNIISFAKEHKIKIIAINDGSSDNTNNLLKEYTIHSNFIAISYKVNKGYGGALKTGFRACETDYCISIDADGQHYLEDVVRLYKMILKTEADLIVGSRKNEKEASLLRNFGKKIIRAFAKLTMKIPIYDINSGMKIYKTNLLKQYLHICPDGMSFSDIITLVFIHQKHFVLETPIKIKNRIAGKSTIGIKTALETVIEILNILILFHPLKVFLPVSFVFMFLGLSWGLFIFIQGKGISVGSSLLILISIIIFLLGLMAEQISSLRINQKL